MRLELFGELERSTGWDGGVARLSGTPAAAMGEGCHSTIQRHVCVGGLWMIIARATATTRSAIVTVPLVPACSRGDAAQ